MAANTKGSRKPAARKAQAPKPTRKQMEAENRKGQQANIRQNTRNQGYQQDR